MKRLELSVVLPCYNEDSNLPLILESYRVAQPKGLSWELILVDNGSTDASAATLKRLLKGPRYAFARSVRVAKNTGYGFGMETGLRAARGAFLAFSHADMQCDPAAVFQAYAACLAAGGSQVIVKGRRQGREWAKETVTGAMSLLATLVLAKPMRDINAQPKVFSAALLPALGRMPRGFEFDVYVLYRALEKGYRLVTVPVVFAARAHGESKWAATFFSRWRTMLRVAAYLFRLRLSQEP